LAIAKIMGLIAIWTKKSIILREWAYTGFFFYFLFAFTVHLNIKDGEYHGAGIAIVLALISYIIRRK